MAYLNQRPLKDKKSNEVLEELGLVLLKDCSEQYSVWNIFPYGKIYFPLDAIIKNWIDILVFVAKFEREKGVGEGELNAFSRIEKLLVEVVLKKKEIKDFQSIGY